MSTIEENILHGAGMQKDLIKFLPVYLIAIEIGQLWLTGF